MKTLRLDKNMFNIFRGSGDSIIVSKGIVFVCKKRNYDILNSPDLIAETLLSSENPSEFDDMIPIVIEDTVISGITTSGGIYIRLPLTVGFTLPAGADQSSNPVLNFGTGSADEDITDYANGLLLFASMMIKEYTIIPESTSVVFMENHPEDAPEDGETDEKTEDSLTIVDGQPVYSAKIFIKLADVEKTSNTDLSVYQRHRGPLILREPTIYYGDFGYRGNLP